MRIPTETAEEMLHLLMHHRVTGDALCELFQFLLSCTIV
jgi:hypothetical protein